MARRMLATAATAAILAVARGNTFTPRSAVQLHKCSGAAVQQWQRAPNGSIFSLDARGTSGYCLKHQPTASTKLGTAVFAANCGGTTTSNNGGTTAPPTDAELWTVAGDTLVSKDPNASALCFAVDAPAPPADAQRRGLQSDPKAGGGTGSLSNCSGPAAQFTFGFGMGGANGSGTIVHKASGLCLTVGRCAAPPPPPPLASSVQPRGTHPCDIYQSAGNPCVAAHSMVRALYADFSGALYSVVRSSDNTTRNISVAAPGGTAASAAQDAFCAGVPCVVEKIFDQSGNGNHLGIFGPDKGVNATRDRHTVGGQPVYSAYFEPGMGYRNINTTNPLGTGRAVGTAVGEEPESMYSVVAGNHFNNHCCFDYGNAEANAHDNGDGTMEALYFGNDEAWWRERPTNKSGPWIMADIENGMYAGDDNIDPEKIPTWGATEFVTAMLKGRPCEMSLKGGNAQEGKLVTLYDGVRPQHNLYAPMRKEGGIILGTGGDNSRGAEGTWFEGAIARGFASKATEDAVQASIVAAGYGR